MLHKTQISARSEDPIDRLIILPVRLNIDTQPKIWPKEIYISPKDIDTVENVTIAPGGLSSSGKVNAIDHVTTLRGGASLLFRSNSGGSI